MTATFPAEGDITRDEATARLVASGIAAHPRKWTMGDTIVVPLGPREDHRGITSWPDMAWLLEDGVPPKQFLVRFIQQEVVRTVFPTLAAACAAAIELSNGTKRSE